jgi:two-component system response regulator FixJ
MRGLAPSFTSRYQLRAKAVPLSTVYIVDDDPGIRFSIALLLETANIRSECFASAEDFLQACGAQAQGCLLLDVSLPGMSGPQLQDALTRRKLDLPIIFLTGYADMPTVVEAMRNGAIDFLAKPVNGAQLLERVQSALELHRTRLQAAKKRRHFMDQLVRLTPREREFLAHAIAGKANKEISADMQISPRTTEGHRARIYLKTNVSSLLELTQQATLADVSLPDVLTSEQVLADAKTDST